MLPLNYEIIIFSKHEFAQHLEKATITEKYYSTPAGILKTKQTQQGIFATKFLAAEHVNYTPLEEVTKLILVGTQFQIQVWKTVLAIPQNQTTSYQTLAKNIGKPKAYRAVANALSQNKIAYFIPCHRVIRADGSLGGYKWGIERKQQLLKIDK
jgi:O-6-methylguanine DNA methyltransferase